MAKTNSSTAQLNLTDNSPGKPHLLPGAYATLMRDIRDSINALAMHKEFLNSDHIREIKTLIASDIDFEIMNVNEVQKMYEMVKMIRNRVLDHDNNLVSGARIQDISTLVSSVNSLISLFIKHQATFDHIAENAKLKECVIIALKGLPVDAQERFYNRLAELDAM